MSLGCSLITDTTWFIFVTVYKGNIKDGNNCDEQVAIKGEYTIEYILATTTILV